MRVEAFYNTVADYPGTVILVPVVYSSDWQAGSVLSSLLVHAVKLENHHSGGRAEGSHALAA